MNNIDLFKDIYIRVYNDLNKLLNEYNLNITNNKIGYLKDNLELFKELNSNGKLIRGFLISLGYKLGDNTDLSYSYSLSLAYELFQTSILVHDDIIDDDDKRRGTSTIHYSNFEKYKDYNLDDAKKVSNSIGICMGDYGFYEANKIIINSYRNDINYFRLLNYYTDIVLKTIEGELIDVCLSFEGKYDLNDIDIEKNTMSVYKLKTAYYTIIGPLSLGMILAGLDDDKINELYAFGEKVGVAFQIHDDILGIFGNVGKVIGSDIKEFKQTILFSEAIKNDYYKNELLKYYGKQDLSLEDIEKVRSIFVESGALKYAEELMNKLYEEAKELLWGILWIKEEDKKVLDGFVDYLKLRDK